MPWKINNFILEGLPQRSRGHSTAGSARGKAAGWAEVTLFLNEKPTFGLICFKPPWIITWIKSSWFLHSNRLRSINFNSDNLPWRNPATLHSPEDKTTRSCVEGSAGFGFISELQESTEAGNEGSVFNRTLVVANLLMRAECKHINKCDGAAHVTAAREAVRFGDSDTGISWNNYAAIKMNGNKWHLSILLR